MDKLGIAIVKELCPICGKEMDGIIMNKILSESNAEKVNALHNKVIGYASDACEECSKRKDNIVYIIGIDPTKSDMNCLETIYRTGQVYGIKQDSEFMKDIDESFILKTKNGVKFMFADKELFNHLKIE